MRLVHSVRNFNGFRCIHLSGERVCCHTNMLICFQVKVKLREVLEWNLPELTLEICKTVKEDVESIDQFRSDLREAVRLEAAEELQVRTPHIFANFGCPAVPMAFCGVPRMLLLFVRWYLMWRSAGKDTQQDLGEPVQGGGPEACSRGSVREVCNG